jgi:hypothetical protein
VSTMVRGAETRQDVTGELPVELIVSCALKTRHAYDPRFPSSTGPEGTSGVGTPTEGHDGRRLAFAQRVRHELVRRQGPIGNPGVAASSSEEGATTPATDGAGRRPAVIARSPEAGHSTILVRGADAPDGSARYHPVLIVWHKVLDTRGHLDLREEGRTPSGGTGPPVLPSPGALTSGFDAPSPDSARLRSGTGLRLVTREADFLRLVHAYRLLERSGLAAAPPLVGIIGTDCVPEAWRATDPGQPVGEPPTRTGPGSADPAARPGDDDGEPVIAWVDASAPLIRTFSRTSLTGWRRRSLLERYEHERDFRLLIAQSAGGDDRGPELEPVAIAECPTCPWREPCWRHVGGDDLSRRLGPGRLDVREVLALRRGGVRSIQDLACIDLEAAQAWYLPEVSHREDAERRLRQAARRAAMLVDGRHLERDTEGRIQVPTATLQIDLDVESSPQGSVYLWGFRVEDRGQQPRYVEFSRFAELSAEEERALARRALGWLRDQVENAESAKVYHYSGYEPSVIRGLAGDHGDPVLDWATGYSQTGFVDLYEIVRQHFFGASGLGLKQVAPCAGFHWRDPDPGGLNSQRWFTTAVHAPDEAERAAAVRRVLEYNEDDVTATAALRAWLQAQ